MNLVVLKGNLTKDPVTRKTKSDYTVTNFTIAINGAKENDTVFVNCTAWAQTADFIDKYFKKGNPILVSGHLTADKDKDGNSTLAAVVDRVDFCGGKKE